MLSAVISKFLGAFFKIPLTNLLGGVGMGYFSCAYSIFMPVYALTVTGLTTSVAHITAKSISRGKYAEIKQIRRTALVLYSLFGIIGMLFIILSAVPLSRFSVGDTQAYGAVILIAPTVFFSCITAVERGIYEGMCNMYPTAVSQIIEGIVKVLSGLGMCRYAVKNPEIITHWFPNVTDIRAVGAMGGILGVTLSSAVSMVFLAVPVLFKRRKNSSVKSSKKDSRIIARELTAVALPTGISALISNMTSLIDMWTITACLSAAEYSISGISADEMPYFVYGSFSGIAVTVFNLVPSVTNMLGKGTLTCVTDAYEKKDVILLRNSTVQALSMAFVTALPCAVGLYVLSEEVLSFLFPVQTDETAICVVPLKLMMTGMVCLCLSYPLFSMLQAVGKPTAPLKIMLTGTAVKLICNLLLVSEKGINGAAVSTSVCYLFVLVLSLAVYLRTVKIKLCVKPFIKTAFSGLVCGLTAWLTAEYSRHLGMSDFGIIISSALTGGIAYISMLFALFVSWSVKGSVRKAE